VRDQKSIKNLVSKLDLHSLRCLCVLVAEGHVSRASAEVGISQSSMSATLAQLRDAFQDPLLVRTAKGMTPTPVALRIAASARAALDLIEDSYAQTRTFDAPVADTIFRISATESVGFMLVPRLTEKLEELAPNVQLVIRPADFRMREQLELGEADLVVAYQPYAPDTLFTSALYEQELCVIASKSHSSIRATLSSEQYLCARHVCYRPANGASMIERQVDEAFAARGRLRRIGVTVPSALSSAPIVATSGHVATVTRALAEYVSQCNDIQVLSPPFELGPVNVSMFWNERTHSISAHVWLRQLIRDLFHGP